MAWVIPIDTRCYCSCTKVIIHVENICQEGFGGNFSFVNFFNFLLHEDTLSCYFLTGARHSQHPRNPLQKNLLNLNTSSYGAIVV